MDAKLLNPFIQAAVEVLEAEVGADVTRGEISVEKSPLTSEDMTVLINLLGDVDGVVMYGMQKNTCLHLVSKILGQDFTELNSLAQSGMAELGNVISGRATIRFSETGYKSNISTPTVLTGTGVEVSTLDFPRIIVPLITQYGTLTVHLALRIKNQVPSINSDAPNAPHSGKES